MELSITLVIVAITALESYRSFNNLAHYQWALHWPFREQHKKEWYRLITSGFIHKDWMHLIVNMYVLYTFGRAVELVFLKIYGELWGRFIYVLMYLTCIVFANLPALVKHRNNNGYRALGASGAVSGIMLIYVLFFPLQKLQFILFPFVGIPAVLIGIGYLIYSSYASRKHIGNIGHDAHLFGGLYGIIFIALTKPEVLIAFIQKISSVFL